MAAGAGVAMLLHVNLRRQQHAEPSRSPHEALLLRLEPWAASRASGVDAACLASRWLVDTAGAQESEAGVLSALQLIRACCVLKCPCSPEQLMCAL